MSGLIFPDRASLAATAGDQLHASFFSRLPIEIRRLIYIESWRTSGGGELRQHVTRKNDQWLHVACIADPHAEDIRMTNYANVGFGSVEKATWLQRLSTEWCIHWACEEAHLARRRDIQRSSFLPVLLSCKRMYLESVESIYENLTFIFTDLIEADDFLARYLPSPSLPLPSPLSLKTEPPSSKVSNDTTPQSQPQDHHQDQPQITFRSIELCIRASNLLTELYYPYNHNNYSSSSSSSNNNSNNSEGPLPIHTGTNGTQLSKDNNPWARVCVHLSRQPRLQNLHIWFDRRDLRPWRKRVSEKRFFSRLLDIKLLHPKPNSKSKPKSNFVLALPELPEIRPEREGIDARLGHIPWDHFFVESPFSPPLSPSLDSPSSPSPSTLPPGRESREGEEEKEEDMMMRNMRELPFTVVRGPRPDNWRIHLVNSPLSSSASFPPLPPLPLGSTSGFRFLRGGRGGSGGGGGGDGRGMWVSG